MRYLIASLVILSLAVTGCVSPLLTQSSQSPAGNELLPSLATPSITPMSPRTAPRPATLAPPPDIPTLPPNWTPPPPPPTPPPVQTANSTAFEMIASDYTGLATGPYRLLVVRADGLVYYEEGYQSHFQPTSVSMMKQGQISEQEVNALIHIIEQFPYQIRFNNSIEYDARSTKLGNTLFNAALFFPVAEAGTYRGKIISANYDPFIQDFTILPDVPDTVKKLWGRLSYIVGNDTAPTTTHPDLYPSFRY